MDNFSDPDHRGGGYGGDDGRSKGKDAVLDLLSLLARAGCNGATPPPRTPSVWPLQQMRSWPPQTHAKPLAATRLRSGVQVARAEAAAEVAVGAAEAAAAEAAAAAAEAAAAAVAGAVSGRRLRRWSATRVRVLWIVAGVPVRQHWQPGCAGRRAFSRCLAPPNPSARDLRASFDLCHLTPAPAPSVLGAGKAGGSASKVGVRVLFPWPLLWQSPPSWCMRVQCAYASPCRGSLTPGVERGVF